MLLKTGKTLFKLLIVDTRGGRLKTKGFNSQKNLDYELEHKFSRVSFVPMQNYYQLLQIAHMINQLSERSKQVVALLEEHSKQTIMDL